MLNKAADLLASKASAFGPMMGAETGATAMWAGFNCMLAADMLREAAAMTTQIYRRGDPLQRAGQPGHGLSPAGRRDPRHRALERAGDPRRAQPRHAARLRQHGGDEGLRAVPRHAPADRHGDAGGGPAAGRRQHRHQRAQGCRRRGRRADRPSGRAAGELHRLLARRQDRRQEVRGVPEARAAGARAASRRCWCSTTPTSTRR